MQCKGCKESYKTENRLPRVLQCGHTLCSSCLEREEKESRCCIDCLECCKKDFRTCGEVPINHALAAAVELLEQLQTVEDPTAKAVSEFESMWSKCMAVNTPGAVDHASAGDYTPAFQTLGDRQSPYLSDLSIQQEETCMIPFEASDTLHRQTPLPYTPWAKAQHQMLQHDSQHYPTIPSAVVNATNGVTSTPQDPEPESWSWFSGQSAWVRPHPQPLTQRHVWHKHSRHDRKTRQPKTVRGARLR